MTTLLELDNLKVHFEVGEKRLGAPRAVLKAVDGVSLRLDARETLAVVGESGCGKSTMANAVLGLAPITAGHVRFDGRDISTLEPKARKALWRDMQVVFQDPVSALNPRMTIAQSIAEPLEIHGHPREKMTSRVSELMELVGLNADHAGKRPAALSGGQRQRVVIARALALNPRLVICDEPVSALDVSIQSQILNLLMRLQAELSLSYLFISHDLGVVRHIADRVVVMYLGTIVETGLATEVFANPVHPYTEALLSAILVPDPKAKRERRLLQGDLPSPIDPPSGCPFRTRCALAEPACAEERPALTPHGPGHEAACLVRAHERKS